MGKANASERMKMRKEKYKRVMQSDMHPYLLYRMGNYEKCRKEHVNRDGLILPKEDPWWKRNFLHKKDPDCNCFIRFVSEARKKQYETEGIPTAPNLDGSGGGNIAVKTIAPL
jgi:hypothetical protein